MAGTGKSSVVRVLGARGYEAIDTDDGRCDPLPDGRQMWREVAIQLLLNTQGADVPFVASNSYGKARGDSIASLMTSTPLSLCCGKQPITKSGQRCRRTTW
jgi:hypothetical protein